MNIGESHFVAAEIKKKDEDWPFIFQCSFKKMVHRELRAGSPKLVVFSVGLVKQAPGDSQPLILEQQKKFIVQGFRRLCSVFR